MIPRLCPPVPLSRLPSLLLAQAPVEKFETAFAQLAGTRHAIAFPYGRTALMCLLEALELKQRDILCPSYTCVVVPHAITYSGNQPVFIDCADGSYLMDLELAGQGVTAETGAIIATPFFGEPVNLDKLATFTQAHPQVAVIQDCAHSFFCEHEGRPVHKAGIAAIYGLNISKLMTSVFGGMVTTDDDLLAARLRLIRAQRVAPATLAKSLARRLYLIASRVALTRPVYGAVRWASNLGVLDRFVRYYEDNRIDMPADYLSGLTGFEAAVGVQQCAAYPDVIAHRRALAAQYNEGLASLSSLQLPQAHAGHTWSHYTVQTPRAAHYREYLAIHGVEAGELLEYFIPDMPVYRDCQHHDRGVARRYIRQVMNLPIHRFVTSHDVARIAQLLRQA